MADDRRERSVPRDTALYDYMDEDWSDRLIRALDRQIAKRKTQQKPPENRGADPSNDPQEPER